jgi:hypothetical protein
MLRKMVARRGKSQFGFTFEAGNRWECHQENPSHSGRAGSGRTGLTAPLPALTGALHSRFGELRTESLPKPRACSGFPRTYASIPTHANRVVV